MSATTWVKAVERWSWWGSLVALGVLGAMGCQPDDEMSDLTPVFPEDLSDWSEGRA